MSRNLPYSEGDWFAVPLRTGGFGVGLIARARRRGKILLGYFFGPRRAAVPDLSDVAKLSARDALRALRFGDLGLIQREWPIIGKSDYWRREDWPMPEFVRTEELSGRMWRVNYSDIDPSEVIAENRILDDGGQRLEQDSLYGYGAIELLLTHLLDPEASGNRA